MKLTENFRTSPLSCVAVMLCASMGMGLVGCTTQQQVDTKAVVAKIAQYEPEVALAVDTLASVVSVLAPADALLITVGQSAFDAAAAALKVACATYAATPNDGTLASVRSTLEQLLSLNADQFLAAAKISNPTSVASAKVAIAGVRTILLLMDGLFQTTQTTAQNVTTAQARNLKLKELEPFLSSRDKQQIEMATGHNFKTVMAYETSLGF
jgi:hypothetical protein